MLDTATLQHPSPRLASKPINELLQHFYTALPWLTDAYGLVQTGVDKKGKERYPQIGRQDGKNLTTDIRPDERMGSLCWFERDGPTLFDFDDATQLSGTVTYQLAAVVWLNLRKIAPALTYDFSEELAEDFITRGLLDSPLGPLCTPERIEHQAERVFERYGWAPATHQLLMYPFAAFRVPMTVRQPYSRCTPPFTGGQEFVRILSVTAA